MYANVIDFLIELGLKDKEALLYKQILSMKVATVKDAAEAAGINRITAHINIDNLIKKGLVSQIKIGGRRAIQAEPPERIKYLLEQQEAKVIQLKSAFPNMIQEISSLIPQGIPDNSVDVRVFEGKDAVMQVYEDTMRAKETRSFADLDKYYKIFPDTRNIWLRAMKKNPNRKVYQLLIDTPVARKILNSKHRNYNVKLLPTIDLFRGFEFSDIIVCDNKVVIAQLDPANVSATVVESKHISSTVKALHILFWKMLS